MAKKKAEEVIEQSQPLDISPTGAVESIEVPVTGNSAIIENPTEAILEPTPEVVESPIVANTTIGEVAVSFTPEPTPVDYMAQLNKAKLYKYLHRVVQGQTRGFNGIAGIHTFADLFGVSGKDAELKLWETIKAEKEV